MRYVSRMRSEGFPFIIWGSGGWTLVRCQLVVASFFASFSSRFRVVNSVSMGKVAKPWSFCCAHVAVSMGEAAKPQSLLLLCRRRVYGGSCKTSVCACMGEAAKLRSFCCASACLWGKLQNLSLCLLFHFFPNA